MGLFLKLVHIATCTNLLHKSICAVNIIFKNCTNILRMEEINFHSNGKALFIGNIAFAVRGSRTAAKEAVQSTAMAMNIALIAAVLQRNILKKYFYELKINFFDFEKANEFVSFFILYLLPPLMLNYFFIFWNNRYKKIIPQYKYHNGKWFSAYLIISLFLPLVYY